MSLPDDRRGHQALVARYTDQPQALPPAVHAAVREAWGGDPVQLYALADLDAQLRLAREWVVLGPHHVAFVREHDGRPEAPPRVVERAAVRAVRETPGLSCTSLALLGESESGGEQGAPALAVVRYSHRQRRTMGNVKFLLEQQALGYDVEPADDDPDAIYAAGLAHAVSEAQAAFAENNLAVVWRLLGYFRPYLGQVALGMAAATGVTLLSLVPPMLAGRLLDGIFKPFEEGALALADARGQAVALVLAIAATYALMQALQWVRLRVLAVLGERVASDLRHELYTHIQGLSLDFFARKRTGSIISRVSSDTDRLWDFVAFGVPEVSLALIKLAALGGVLLWLDVPMGLVMVVPVPIILWLIHRHGRTMERIFLRCWRKWSALTDVLSDTIPGMRVVKAFSQEEREVGRFGSRNEIALGQFNVAHHIWTKFWPLLMLMVHTMAVAVWALALGRIIQPGPSTLSVGTFVSFLLYLTMFYQPIEVMGQLSRVLNRATSSAHRIFEVLDTRAAIVDRPDPIRLDPVEGRVTFDNVVFAYDGVRQIVRGISFEVKPGEMIGLVGPSGAGKTTLINLLVRFYDVTGGRILLDGVDIRDLDAGHYRRQIGMVLQDPHLFHGSVLDNIRYGVPEATLEQVVEAARSANAHDFVCKLPHGYDTIVGERGQSLSGGERQRVSIARAILSNPRILILDEATSSVDTETERKIQQALDRLVAGRTVFAIAHRLSTLTRATRLFVIEEGRIGEQGTHAELLALPTGTYAKLHRLQQELHESYAV